MLLRFILGDQLHESISSLKGVDLDRDVIVMCEVIAEATYVKHHKKKIAFLFSAMRNFAKALTHAGYQVQYTKIDDPENTGSFQGEIARAVKRYQPDQVIVTEPGEYRVLKDMETWETHLGIPVEIRPDDRFLCTHTEFQTWAKGRKELRMEYFYRDMRRKYGILMQGDQPEGGQWNYDADNRQPPKAGLYVPKPYASEPDTITQDVLDCVERHFPDHFDNLHPFYFAVTREQALEALNLFIQERLFDFGTYQDAMIQGQPWMYHSHLSFYLNCGLLTSMECTRRAEAAYYAGDAPLNAVEGFIRQIIGWREYVRGIYWLKMPEYAKMNALKAKRKLPDLYWGKATQMNCLRCCVQETQENAYAHHIQRLMVLGNFALLAGVHPDAMNEWYMIVYADAYEWVELPNVTGMILFADGGILGSKPYAASGAYINKMSDYCQNCQYKVTKKSGPEACPFNYLYWDFLIRNADHLRTNHRLRMIYKTLERMSAEKVQTIRDDSTRFLKALDDGEKV